MVVTLGRACAMAVIGLLFLGDREIDGSDAEGGILADALAHDDDDLRFVRDELLELAGAEQGVDGIRLAYGQSNGSDELRKRIASLYAGAGDDNVLVTVGGAEANFTSFWHLLESEGKAAVILPNYGQVPGLLDSFDSEVRPVHLIEERGWQPDLEALAEFAEPGDISDLQALQQFIEDYTRELAERQGLQHEGQQLQLTGFPLFVHMEGDLPWARSGLHQRRGAF